MRHLTNTYFVVEVIRALAEESGSLEGIIGKGVPGYILAGGVQQVMRRRLARVPASAQPLLRLAAVAGRQLDLSTLELIWPDAQSLVQESAEAGVLEMSEGCWRFSHDKLRENLLAELSPKETVHLHGLFADTLLRSRPGDPGTASTIAHHYASAQRFSEAAEHYAVAGEAALSRGAMHEALTLLEQAAHMQAQCVRPLLEQLRVWRCIAQARFGLGQLRETDAALRRVFALAGQPLPESRLGLRLKIGGILARQLARAVVGSRQAPPDAAERACLSELATCLSVTEAYVGLGPAEMLVLGILSLHELTDAHDFVHMRAPMLMGMSYMLSLTPLHALGDQFLRRAQREAEAHSGSAIEVLYHRACALTHGNRGNFPLALPAAYNAVEVSRKLGDELGLERRLVELLLLGFHGMPAAEMESVSKELLQRTQESQHLHYSLVAQLGLALVAFWRKDVQRAAALLEIVCDKARKGNFPHTEILTRGTLAECLLTLGEWERAEAQADETLHQAQTSPLTMNMIGLGLSAMLEVYLQLGERQRRILPQLRSGLRYLARLALRIPVARPSLLRTLSRLAWQFDQVAAAVSLMMRSLAMAKRGGLPRDMARAHHFLGQYAKHGSAQALIAEPAQQHFAAALKLFEELGSALEAERTRGELASD